MRMCESTARCLRRHSSASRAGPGSGGTGRDSRRLHRRCTEVLRGRAIGRERVTPSLKEHKDSLSDKCRQAAGLPTKAELQRCTSALPAAHPMERRLREAMSLAPRSVLQLRRRAQLLCRAVLLRAPRRKRRRWPKPVQAALEKAAPGRPAARSLWSASSRMQSTTECGRRRFTCRRSGTSRARSSGTMTGLNTRLFILHTLRTPTTQRRTFNIRCCVMTTQRFHRNTGNMSRTPRQERVGTIHGRTFRAAPGACAGSGGIHQTDSPQCCQL